MTTRHAVFIEPDGGLREFLVENKHRVESVMPGQGYASHPPHCTLITAAYGEESEALHAALVDAVAEFGPMRMCTSGMIVFHDDALADGGHTVAVRAEPGAELTRLQLVVAQALEPFVRHDPCAPASAISWPPRFQQSLDRFGFPFVGSHWIPHFTIASLKTNKENALLKELAESRVDFSFTLEAVSLWRVDGEAHEKQFSVSLRG